MRLLCPLFLAASLGLIACTSFEGSEPSDASPGGAGGAPSGAQGGTAGTPSGGTSGATASVPCATPAACDDKNPCTADACADDFCQWTKMPKGVSCSDGNTCNGEESCDGEGACRDAPALPVDDGKACTADLCDPTTGAVRHQGIPGCPCTAAKDCDDGNPCTEEQCEEAKCVFSNQPQGTGCDDGNKCTIDDQCDGTGKCVGAPQDTDDGNPCTKDECDPTSGNLLHTAVAGKACDDGSKCTKNDQCNPVGACLGVPLSANDGNECTTDSCDKVTGNISHKGVNGCKKCQGVDSECDDGNPCTDDACKAGFCEYKDVLAGGACDDGNPCTVDDTCDTGGQCVGTLQSVEDDGNPCTKDECDPATGSPVHPPAPGQPCSDEDACTLDDLCDDQGQCVGAAKGTDDGNACTTDACDKVTGSVTHTSVADCKKCEIDGDCNDGNPCATAVCVAGECAYTFVTAGTPCNDGNACTSGDQCDGAGKCAGAAKSCKSPPNTDCYPSTGTCDPATGACSYAKKATGTACDDKNQCTKGDACDSKGNCKSGAPVVCNTPPNLACFSAQGACNTSKGTCSYAPLTGTGCNDENACTSSDKCDASGACSGVKISNCKPCSTSSDCADGSPCTLDVCKDGRCENPYDPACSP